MWLVVDRADLGGHDQYLLVTTGAETGKAKRLRHTPRVLVAPCDARGNIAVGVEELEAVADVLTDAVDRCRVDAEQHAVSLTIAGTHGTRVLGSLRQLEVAVGNLVENAVVYSGPCAR